MNSLRDKFKKSKTVRETTKVIEGVGPVLFIEPPIAEMKRATDSMMKYKTVVSSKGKNRKATSVLIDSKSNTDLYNKTLIVMCLYDPDTRKRVFESAEDLDKTVFGLNEDGTAQNGTELLKALLEGVTEVISGETISKDDIDSKKKS